MEHLINQFDQIDFLSLTIYHRMIRTVIVPEQETISINLPRSYIGKQVEVIAFTIDGDIHETILMDEPLTYLASEKSLAKDWSTPEEDKAWQDL